MKAGGRHEDRCDAGQGWCDAIHGEEEKDGRHGGVWRRPQRQAVVVAACGNMGCDGVIHGKEKSWVFCTSTVKNLRIKIKREIVRINLDSCFCIRILGLHVV